jgi:hypothetical protein
VRRLAARYNNLLWMKLSEVARYWAARELTRSERQARGNYIRGAVCRAGFHRAR